MSRPGFYNDNEYRAYPFLELPLNVQVYEANALPPEAIVDAGFVFGSDSGYDETQDFVYLRKITASDGILLFHFSATVFCPYGMENILNNPCHNADTKGIVFQRNYTFTEDSQLVVLEPEWTTEYAESVSTACTDDPLWNGFLVTGKLETLIKKVEDAGGSLMLWGNGEENGVSAFVYPYVIEPARIQNLRKSFLRSVSVGNYERVVAPACDSVPPTPCADADTQRQIIPVATCLHGDIQFKEGYNTRITQTDRTNTITFTAEKGAGKLADNALCENHGEVPLYADEINNKPFIHNGNETTPPLRSKFLSGGWSCKDLIFTINGVGGNNVNLVGGKNIQIGYDDEQNAITVNLSNNARGRCNG